MSEVERQVRSWWSRLLAWLRGAQHGDAANKARSTWQDVRTSDAGRKAEAALRDLRQGEVGRRAEAIVSPACRGSTRKIGSGGWSMRSRQRRKQA